MNNTNDNLFKEYKSKYNDCSNYLEQGIELLRKLLDRNFESYIIGCAVCDYYLIRPIKQITILTPATVDELQQIFPSLTINNGIPSLVEKTGTFYFETNNNDNKKIVSKAANKYYNKKLSSYLEKKPFTISALSLSPALKIIDIFSGLDDIDEEIIRVIDTTKNIFLSEPIYIMDAIVLVSEYGFTIDKKTLKNMVKAKGLLVEVDRNTLIKKLQEILGKTYSQQALELIDDNGLLERDKELDLFVSKVLISNNKLNLLEKMSLLYLILGNIPNAENFSQEDLSIITDNITFSRLLLNTSVTPMMVYNIGEDRLLIANELAKCYSSKYTNQARTIKKLKRGLKIDNLKELNFSSLELINILNGERSLKIKIIMNLLLEKVINGEISNKYDVLKKEAMKINEEIDNIFNYTEPKEIIIYNDEKVQELLAKYKKEYDFLIKVYLNDEKELYNLSALERDEAVKEAKMHAREFLLETSQYKVLEDRRLI